VKHREAKPPGIGAQVALRLGSLLADTDLIKSAPDFLNRVGAFAIVLSEWGSKLNLTADPGDPDEIVFHVMDSLAPILVSDAIFAIGFELDKSRRLVDIGSGAGFPGLILAAATGAETILFESRRKRATFLQVAAATMRLPRVTVVHARASADNVPTGFDLMTARAVGNHPAFLRMADAALNSGGVAIVFLSPEQRLDSNAAASSGMVEPSMVRYSIPRGSNPVQRVLRLWRKDR